MITRTLTVPSLLAAAILVADRSKQTELSGCCPASMVPISATMRASHSFTTPSASHEPTCPYPIAERRRERLTCKILFLHVLSRWGRQKGSVATGNNSIVPSVFVLLNYYSSRQLNTGKTSTHEERVSQQALQGTVVSLSAGLGVAGHAHEEDCRGVCRL